LQTDTINSMKLIGIVSTDEACDIPNFRGYRLQTINYKLPKELATSRIFGDTDYKL